MSETINANQLQERLQQIVERVRKGGRFTVLYQRRPAFDIVPVGNPPEDTGPLEADPLYQTAPVGFSDAGDAAGRHDEVLYR